MLNNKADFILEYNERKKENLKRDDVDWSQSRVLFLANSFTSYQQNAINFKDLPIELWEVKKFDNQTILYSQLKSTDIKESISSATTPTDSQGAVQGEPRPPAFERQFWRVKAGRVFDDFFIFVLFIAKFPRQLAVFNGFLDVQRFRGPHPSPPASAIWRGTRKSGIHFFAFF